MKFEDKVGLFDDTLSPGSPNYRAFVGLPSKYDLLGALQFNVLTALGLRQHHYLLDIGCGSLRSGRLFIPYLLPERYFGIEPEQWLIEEGIKREVGQDLINIKSPQFSNDSDFNLSVFNQEFDFIIAHSIFSHASQNQIIKCLSEAKKVMNEICIFVATFMQGEEDYTDDEWVYPNCSTYTMDCIVSLVKEQNLICKPLDFYHPSRQTWIAIVSPEIENTIPHIISNTRALRIENELKLCQERLAKLENNPQ
jgi:hypothetical protein